MFINGKPPQPGGVNGVYYNRNGTASSLEAQEAAYRTALKLVARIDGDLARGTRHYRDKAGRLLTCLDDVVRAILANDLLAEEA